jgi:hypothetical protein
LLLHLYLLLNLLLLLLRLGLNHLSSPLLRVGVGRRTLHLLDRILHHLCIFVPNLVQLLSRQADRERLLLHGIGLLLRITLDLLKRHVKDSIRT